MENVKYTGCFFDPAVLAEKLLPYPRKPLQRPIEAPHITFAYRPVSAPVRLFGLPVTVQVCGYGCDEENEALLVKFVELPPQLAESAAEIALPHITLSVSETGEPVNSRRLTYRPITPFLLEGTFGAMDTSGTVHLLP